MRPRYAFVADDFTGATDTLATLALAGLRTSLYVDAERMARDQTSEAIGLATAARSLATSQLVAALARAADALRAIAAPIAHYKVCSTFDSAPHIGSIGAAVDALRVAVPHRLLPIVGGQPNLRRYCLFATLFAGAGATGDVHRIDRHPTMSRHPVTPMLEADLRRHLAAQGLEDVHSVDYTRYAAPLSFPDGAVLFDVATQADLSVIGDLLLQHSRQAPLLAVGPSSVAQAMIAAWRNEGSLPAASEPLAVPPASGPVFVLSGSQSPVTAHQLASSPSFVKIEIGLDDADDARNCIALLRDGRHVLAHTGGTRRAAGHALETAGARLLASVLHDVPLTRAGVSGGDTSSHAVRALDLDRLEFAAQLCPGVALCRVHGRKLDGLELMLKGGQMGPPDIFERLITPGG